MHRFFLALVFLAASEVNAAEKAAAPVTLASAQAIYREGQLSRSAAAYEKLIQKSPSELEAWLDLGALSRELGRTPRAIEAMGQAKRLNPRNPDIAAELGWLMYHSRAFGPARTQFDDALTLDPNHPGALLGAGVSRLSQEQAVMALPFLERLQRLRPGFAAVYYFLGKAYQQLGQPSVAIEQWTATVAKDWSFVEARLPLAQAYEAVNDPDQAWAQYARYLNVFPQNAAAFSRYQALTSRLTQKPADLLPIIRLSITENLPPVPNPESIPEVLIGIGTDARGRPQGLRTLSMRFAGPFEIVGKKSGKIYASGGPGMTWRAAIAGTGQLEVIAPDGQRYGPFRGTIRFRYIDSGRQTFLLEGSPADATRSGWHDMEYRGELELSPVGRILSPVNAVNVEAYLLGVVPAEVPARWPMDVLKAQAVIARNQTLMRRHGFKDHRRYHYALCDSQHCQVYKGIAAEDPRVHEAVLATRGQVAYYRGGLANTLYHSTCGGFTQNSSDLKGWYPVAYLKRQADAEPGRLTPPSSPWNKLLWMKNAPGAYCNAPEMSPGSEFRWLRIVPAADLNRQFSRYHLGKIQRLLPVGGTISGNVQSLWVEGRKKTRKFERENEIRYRLGSLRSTLFLVETHRNAAGEPEEYWFYGGGWGHGVGLCQTGAAGQAAAGKTYADIIAFYYAAINLHTLSY